MEEEVRKEVTEKIEKVIKEETEKVKEQPNPEPVKVEEKKVEIKPVEKKLPRTSTAYKRKVICDKCDGLGRVEETYYMEEYEPEVDRNASERYAKDD